MQTSARLALATLLILAFVPCSALAQDDRPAKADAEAKLPQSQASMPKQPPEPFLLTISINESDAGKPAAGKNYVVTVIADDNHGNYESLRDNDRIPYTSDKEQKYHSVGTEIDLTNATRQGETLFVKLTVGNNALAEKGNGVNLPQDHDWRVAVVAVLPSGKPTVVYSATDAISGHKVEILATAKLINYK